MILSLGEAQKVVECLKRQTFKDFEVIIASEPGIVNAMNLALENAVGEIFVRLDSDVEMPETWLESLVIPFMGDPELAGCTGPTFVPIERRKNRDSIRIWEKPNRFLRWLQDDRKFAPAAIYKCGMVSYDSNYEERFCYGDTFQPDHLEGTNWAMRTELIRKVGGFDPAFDGVSEWFDTDVEAKIKKLGYRFIYNPNAYLWHLLDFSPNYGERFNGSGRIKNWIRFHSRHSNFHPKMIVYLVVWIGYFFTKGFKK